MKKDDEHVYYWAWRESDNPNHIYTSPHNPEFYRVFRADINSVEGIALTEPMSRDEAIAACERIIKLTGGREI